MSVIGTIAVNVVSRHTGFVRGMNESRRSLGRLATGVTAADRSIRLLGRTMAVGFAAFSTGRLVSNIRATAEELDALGKTSDKLGIASEKLAGLRLGAELEGIGSRTLDMALQRMVRRISEVASVGKGEAAPALKELGLEAQKLEMLTPDRMLERIADAMSGVTNQSDRVRLAFKLFDSEGVAMVQMLGKGAAGLEEFHRQAEQLGIAISRDRIKQVEEFNDAMTRLGKSIGGFKERIVIDIAPAATSGIKALEEAIKGAKIIERDLRVAQGGPAAGPGFFQRLATGQTSAQKAITDFIVRRDLKMGVAAGTAAPDMLKSFGVRGVASTMAMQPGFDPARVQLARERGAIADTRRAEAQAIPTLVNMGREAGKRWINSFTQMIGEESDKEGGKVKTLGERLRDSLMQGRKALVDNQRQFLLGAFTGRHHAAAAEFRLAMARIRKQDATSDTPFAPNEALERGTSAAYAASRQSDRVNRVLQEQLVQQRDMAGGIAELVAQGRQGLEDVFAG